MRRYRLRNDQRDRIKDFLPGREGHVGGTAAVNRLLVEESIVRRRKNRGLRRVQSGHHASALDDLAFERALVKDFLRGVSLLSGRRELPQLSSEVCSGAPKPNANAQNRSNQHQYPANNKQGY